MNKATSAKILTGASVYFETLRRIEWTFRNFNQICVSFSGGKDSTVLFHLAGQSARITGKKFSVLFIDWEVQYKRTIDHIINMKSLYADYIEHFYWVCLPLRTVNGVSQYEPEWVCWDPECSWVRQPPDEAITDVNYFPFYYPGMTFEEFIPSFSSWLSDRTGLAMLVGIRADESLNRFRGIVSGKKLRYADDKPWTTASTTGFFYNIYPLYDWKIKDIWLYLTRYDKIYNSLYDLMYQAGVSLKHMRICEAFGPEQRRSLWLFHILEPEIWQKVCTRVAGAHSGAIYANQSGKYYSLNNTFSKPDQHTWRSYALFLLDSMPHATAEHYKTKIAIYIHWYQSKGYPDDIPDEQHDDLGLRDIPSWRRICKVLLKNDYWCRMLSFSPNKSKCYKNYMRRMQEKRKIWQII